VCFTGSLEYLSELRGVAVDVELCFDQWPRHIGEPGAQIGLLEQPSDGRGERGGIPLRDHKPRLSVAYHFRDSGYVGRDAGRAKGHRLQEDGRQAVAVPIGTDDARRGEHRCVLDEPDQLALGAGSEQLDPIFEAQVRDPHPQLYLFLAGTDDLAGERATLVGEDGAGFDQVDEALFLDEPSDPHDPGPSLARRPVREPFEVQTVMDPA
jgi:hypothetical protein